MSKGLEPLLAAKESKNKHTKYRGTKDGNADGWMKLMKRYLEKAHTRATPLVKAWTIIEYLEHEARDYIANKSEGERDTDDKVFAEPDPVRFTCNNNSEPGTKITMNTICNTWTP